MYITSLGGGRGTSTGAAAHTFLELAPIEVVLHSIKK